MADIHSAYWRELLASLEAGDGWSVTSTAARHEASEIAVYRDNRFQSSVYVGIRGMTPGPVWRYRLTRAIERLRATQEKEDLESAIDRLRSAA